MNRKLNRVRQTLGALVLAISVGAASAQAPEKFKFSLNWFAVGDHAAYWVALEKGYYAKAGLEVTLENSKGSGDSIAKVDTDRADAGLADTVAVLAADARVPASRWSAWCSTSRRSISSAEKTAR